MVSNDPGQKRLRDQPNTWLSIVSGIHKVVVKSAAI
jgi:hypothetical protein